MKMKVVFGKETKTLLLNYSEYYKIFYSLNEV